VGQIAHTKHTEKSAFPPQKNPYQSYFQSKLLTIKFNMTLWYPNTDGTVKGLLEVISQDSECEHPLSIFPPQLPSNAPVFSISTHPFNQLFTTDTESVQQNGVHTDESSPQPPAVQPVSQKTPSCNNILYKPGSDHINRQFHQHQGPLKNATSTKPSMSDLIATETLRGPSDRES
jgi:hypothetical protein